ncbi:MAG: isoprenylcysteine carboxyl methyltransferase [Robiginitomaculum sp.]|nr:MAG: isoprenylcysteine carboxyl methyltransferase [Robiginitomaculum sp.]
MTDASTNFLGYGLWPLVILNSAIFIIFAFSFTKPSSSKDWKSFGAFSAFIIALFTEMYGFPLSIYFLSGWLSARFPDVNWLAHDSGHFWEMAFGWRANPHFGPFHWISFGFIFAGFILLSSAWPILQKALRTKTLAQSGIYAKLRHPQYVAFILIMFGFLVQWPTILTLLMFPVLLVMYWRLALKEERDTRAKFGEAYDEYANKTPRFIPRFRKSVGA